MSPITPTTTHPDVIGLWLGDGHREKTGTKSVAIKLYGKRKQHALEGKKLPELAYSKSNKRSYKIDVPRLASLKEWFGFSSCRRIDAQRDLKHVGTSCRKGEVGALHL